MKTIGIICEYNPFHNGHARQLRFLREKFGPDTRIVCVMSGNFVQRGAPAMWDKFSRSRAAVACGADLVLELPVTSVLQSAEGFARGGIEILTRLGCVDGVCFGAEAAETDFMLLAKRMDAAEVNAALRDYLDQGLPYAAARQQALQDTDHILSSPNNILGFEYCRAILSLGSSLQPIVMARSGSYHAKTADPDAPSATAIRLCYPNGSWKCCMPEPAASVLQDAPWYAPVYGERAVLAVLRSMSDQDWEHCAHGSEGLWSKAMKAARASRTLEELMAAIKSKRYPRSRIQRLLLCAYLGISSCDLHTPLPYVRALAASDTGCKILHDAKKMGTIPIVNAGECPSHTEFGSLERRASDLFTLFAAPEFPCIANLEKQGRIFIQKLQK